MNTKRKVALVTGAARGIGLGIAEILANDGCDIVIGDIIPAEQAAESVKKLEGLGAEVLYCQCDISNVDSRESMLDAIFAKFGRLNVLVNNAGVAPKVRADILDATEDSYDFVMNINLKGPYFLTQAVAKRMIEAKQNNSKFKASIINISSTSSTVASVSRGEYCISKAGVSMSTKLWAARLGEFDIPVYEIRPGIIMTPMTEPVRGKYDKLIEEGLCVQKRWGYPEDIGKAVAMLARGDLPYSTGQVIMIDGGFTLQRL